ncbi:MAG: C69 family dipeptidase [Algoriphagus sp.]|nr:C69 family dipeptidase [Algoriphagus sp.]
MCDTLVALPAFTRSGNLILGKNSDREPQEAQAIAHFPKAFPKEKELQCTFIKVSQVSETNEVILSKPFQMWGAEMGVNEYGLVIGNEAVFTNVKFDKKKVGLTGMDLLRLALERSKKAMEAVICITDLLSEFGQNACGGYQNNDFYYHNSFLIADHSEAFILETAGKSWAYKRVTGIGSISNALSIAEDFEAIHLEKEARTIQRIFAEKGTSFQGKFSDLLYSKLGRAVRRQACTTGFLEKRETGIEAVTFFEALRQHNLPEGKFAPKKATTGSICMHATGLTNPSDTTGSMVAEIRKNQAHTVWLTATSHPCMSLYLPFYFGENDHGPLFNPSSKPDQSLWWKAKKLHKWIAKEYQNRQPEIRKGLDAMQDIWLDQEKTLLHYHPFNSDLLKFSNSCISEYNSWLDDKLSVAGESARKG